MKILAWSALDKVGNNVAVADQLPLGRHQSFHADRASGVDSRCADSNLSTCYTQYNKVIISCIAKFVQINIIN